MSLGYSNYYSETNLKRRTKVIRLCLINYSDRLAENLPWPIRYELMFELSDILCLWYKKQMSVYDIQMSSDLNTIYPIVMTVDHSSADFEYNYFMKFISF